MVVFLPLKTVSEANMREHWAAKAIRTKKARKVAYLMVPTLPLPVVVTLTRYSRGSLDDDNLRGALKACRDGIADRFGVPDNHPGIEWRYAQAKAKPGDHGVQVRIEAAA